jgi:hypothetical protein
LASKHLMMAAKCVSSNQVVKLWTLKDISWLV